MVSEKNLYKVNNLWSPDGLSELDLDLQDTYYVMATAAQAAAGNAAGA